MNKEWINAINSLPRTDEGIEDIALQYECWFIQCANEYYVSIWKEL